MAEHFSLRWNNFHRNMSSGFRTLLMEDSLVDVTLAAEGRFVQAHRLVLSVCSPYFKDLFSVNPCNHPIVILKDVRFKQLTDILSFMYQGEVNVCQGDLPDFLKTAELLQIRGLAEQNVDKESKSATPSQDNSVAKCSAIQTPQSAPSQPKVRVSKVVQDTVDKALLLQQGTSGSKVPTLVTAGSVAQALLQPGPPVTPPTGQVPLGEGPSTSLLLGMPMKQELPDIPCDVEQDVDSYDYLASDVHDDETGLSDAPIILHDGDPERPQVIEKSLWTAPAHGGATKSSIRNLSADIATDGAGTSGADGMKQPKVLKKLPRKQRTIALNKIKRFLFTPKRSRRIAFARKMKQKKRVLLKSSLSSDSVPDISKPLPAIRNAVNMRNVSEIAPCLKEDIQNPSVPVGSLNEVHTKERKEDEKKDGLNKEYMKENEIRRLIVSVEDASKMKFVPNEERKISSPPAEESKDRTTSKNSRGKKVRTNDAKNKNIAASLKNVKEKNCVKKNNSVVKNKTSSAANKKKMIVVIAAEKRKSAVALARKMQSPVRRKSGATAHLRSSTPNSNSNLKHLGVGKANEQSCQLSGCLGCREVLEEKC